MLVSTPKDTPTQDLPMCQPSWIVTVWVLDKEPSFHLLPAAGEAGLG